MAQIVLTIQLIVSVLMMILILAQNKEGGLSGAMGGSGQTFESVKRGAEKVIFSLTTLLSIVFLANAVLMLLV